MGKLNAKGTSLAYTRHGTGVPLVLIHGFPLDGSIWQEVIPFLETQFDLIVPDLRGFGSSGSVDESCTMTSMGDDLAGLLDHLGIGKVALAGHSMGGYVALAFARKYPKRVSSLALVSSQAAGDSEERKQGRYKMAEEVAQNGVGVVADAMAAKLSAVDRVQTFVLDLITRQSRTALICALRAMAEREDLVQALPAFRFPILLLHGDSDALIPIERAREIKSIVATAQLVEMTGVGHMPMMEAAARTAEALSLLK